MSDESEDLERSLEAMMTNACEQQATDDTSEAGSSWGDVAPRGQPDLEEEAVVVADGLRSRSRSRSPRRPHGRCDSSDSDADAAMVTATSSQDVSTGSRRVPAMWLAPAPRPPSVPGTEWWASCIFTSLETQRQRLPIQQSRPMIHDSNCSGTGCEQLTFKALGIDVRTRAMSEKKEMARSFIKSMWPELIRHGTHLYSDMKHMTGDGGKCHIHHKTCRPVGVRGSVDLAVQGLPCQPFSRQRSNHEVHPDQHKSFGTVFDVFFTYIDETRPKGVLIEEVCDFAKKTNEDGDTYLEAFVNILEGDYHYSVRVFKLSACVFGEVQRERLHLLLPRAAPFFLTRYFRHHCMS